MDKFENKWELTDEEFKTNTDEIFMELSLFAKKTDNPSFIIVGGQAGSGKSALVSKEYKELKENAIIIDQDELRIKYPKEKYKEIHDNCTEREEFLALKPYISKTIAALIDKAKNGGYNIILESALRSINSFIDITQELKKRNYKTKLSVIAVSEVESNISMLTRYCYYLKKDGECRRNTRLDHSAVENVRKNIQRLDNLEIFDDITISTRAKDIDSLPIQTYSKSTNNEMTPLQAYDKTQKDSFDDTRKNFNTRYEQLKVVLEKYEEYEQLEKLEKIKDSYEKENSEGR